MRWLASAASDSPTEGLVIAPGESNVIEHRRLQMAGRIVEKFRVQADLGRSTIVVCTECQIDVITPTSIDHERSIGGLLDYDFEDGGKANKIDDETYKDVITGEIYHRPS
jgi:hypothetical protein